MNYDPDQEKSKDVYLCLIKMYLSPPNLEDYGIRLPDATQPEANVRDALSMLTRHHHLMDTAKVCNREGGSLVPRPFLFPVLIIKTAGEWKGD